MAPASRLFISIIAAAVLALVGVSAFAATPSSGTVSFGSPPATWSGGPYTSTTSDPVTATCENSDCDLFTLTVSGTDAVAHEVTVRIEWTSPTNDLDLHVYNSVGSEVKSSGEAVSNFEQVTFPAAPGVYTVQALVYRAVNESYTGTASVAATGATPEPPNEFRTGTYQRFNFGFRPEVKLPEQERSLIFLDQDTEPEVEIDRFGTIYVGAIRGIPGGVDFWRSDDKGATFRYMGEPDGTQNPNPVQSTEGGLGGGDVDLALGDPFTIVPPTAGNPAIQSSGRVYITSLWLGSATLAVSVDRGENWAPVPFTTAQLDRQWNVARGERTLYMSLRKLANAEQGKHDVFVVQSDDGLTFTKGSYVMDPETGVPDNLSGNSVLTADGTLLGVFVSADQKDLYIYKNPKTGTPPPAELPVGPTDVPVFVPDAFEVGKIFHGAGDLTVANKFPIMAVDQGGNVHLTFSDRHNIYLISCPSGLNPTVAANWTKPLPLNAPRVAGFEFTTTCVLPWIRGGAAGTVAAMWYGTPMMGDPDTPAFETANAPWRVIYAQVENALSATPTVLIDVASKQGNDGIIHQGQICLRGLGCPDDTRELAEYSSFAMDPEGFPNIIYSATLINGVDPPSTSAICFFTKATLHPAGGGGGVPVTKLDCHDPSVSTFGGWHEVNDARATDGHYCRNVGVGKKGAGAWLQFGYNGTAVDMRIARGPRGGNAEVFIDGASKGMVEFYRPASDPLHPDNSGKQDLTFGEFVHFESGSGHHTFKLVVKNTASASNPPRDMVYIDEFLITGGSDGSQGNPTDLPQVTIGSGQPYLPVLLQNLSFDDLEVFFEVVGEKEFVGEAGELLFRLKDLRGVTVAQSAPGPTAVLRWTPTGTGPYRLEMTNQSGTPASYRITTITTTRTSGGSLAAAFPGGSSTPASSIVRTEVGHGRSGEFALALARGGPVEVRVFNVAGQMVAMVIEERTAGRQAWRWDGRTTVGRHAASGVYFFHFRLPDGVTADRRSVVLR
jgi:hypothetical protein